MARPTGSCPAPRSPAKPTISPGCRVNPIGPASAVTSPAPSSSGRPACTGRRRATPNGVRPTISSTNSAGCRVRDRPRGDAAAVAHDGDTVGDAEHLVQPVADIHHATAARPQPVQHGEQALDLGGRQACGGLVQHDRLGGGGQRAGDGDDGLVGAREVRDPCRRVDRAADLRQRARRLRGGGGPVHQAEPGARIAGGQGDVLRHAHPLDQAEILVDERDRQAVGDRIDPHAADADLAGIGAVHAGQHLDQRGLAGPVAAEQRMDLAGPDVEIHAVDGPRAAERLHDPGHCHDRRHVVRLGHARSLSFSPSCPRLVANATANALRNRFRLSLSPVSEAIALERTQRALPTAADPSMLVPGCGTAPGRTSCQSSRAPSRRGMSPRPGLASLDVAPSRRLVERRCRRVHPR